MFDIMEAPRGCVGFVGVGTMAAPMVERLVSRGWVDVHVHDLDPRATAALAHLPVTVHDELETLLASCDVVLLSLPGPAAVEATVSRVRDRDSNHRLTLVNTSTSGLASSRKCVEALEGTGVEFVDAPVSGGATAAGTGGLTFILSGPEGAVRGVRAVLRELGSNLFVVGEKPGLAQAVKSANNMLGLGALLATAEATSVLGRLGVDVGQAVEVFNASSGRNSATLEKFPREVLTERYAFGFSFGSVVKDLSLFLEVADDVGLAPSMATHAHAAWRRAAEEGWAELDCTRIVAYVDQGDETGPADAAAGPAIDEPASRT